MQSAGLALLSVALEMQLLLLVLFVGSYLNRYKTNKYQQRDHIPPAHKLLVVVWLVQLHCEQILFDLSITAYAPKNIAEESESAWWRLALHQLLLRAEPPPPARPRA